MLVSVLEPRLLGTHLRTHTCKLQEQTCSHPHRSHMHSQTHLQAHSDTCARTHRAYFVTISVQVKGKDQGPWFHEKKPKTLEV